MFDFLKKKITNFIDGITKKEQAKEEITAEVSKQEPQVEKIEAPAKAIKEARAHKPRSEKQGERKTGEKANEAIIGEKWTGVEETAQKEKELPEKEVEVPEHKQVHVSAPPKEKEALRRERPLGEKEKKTGIKLGIAKHIGALITGQVEISRNDVIDMLDALELEMLEADVAMEVAEQIKKELEEKLIGQKIRKGEINNFVKTAIKGTLVGIMANEKQFELVEKIKSLPKPVKIVVLGVNGAGKSTTIAKIAKMLLDSDLKVVLAASDTFRAAAIEQLSLHAEKLGVRIIKREYGSDPTAVAFDAAGYAKAHNIDVVLIDTAGRQDTNLSLINELKKMDRVIKPDIKIYVGESIAGNSIVEQIQSFNREIGVDGIILTKLDCDPKGGSIISIAKVTRLPVLYLGIGQRYEDLERFDAEKIADRILS